MRIFAGWVTSLLFFALGVQTPASHAEPKEQDIQRFVSNFQVLTTIQQIKSQKAPEIVFSHGDISWLPLFAKQAGWPEETISKLGEIILRESGGCPNRRGGDKVDKHCNLTGVSEWNHRSDTGLLQINGVNYDLSRNKWALVCLKLSICTQEPLLDPITNLKAGYVLYQESGWRPWDPCSWDVAKCPKTKKKP